MGYLERALGVEATHADGGSLARLHRLKKLIAILTAALLVMSRVDFALTRDRRADASSGCERLKWSCCLLAVMPDRVDLSRIRDVTSRVAVKYHQIGKLARGQYAAIIKLRQFRGVRFSGRDRLHRRQPGLNHQREFQMLSHSRNAQAHAGIRAEADLHTGVVDRFEILLVGCDGRSVLRGRRQRKGTLAIGGIIELRANRRMQRALEEWLPPPGRLLGANVTGVVGHDGGGGRRPGSCSGGPGGSGRNSFPGGPWA